MKVYIVVAFNGTEPMACFKSEKGANKYIRDQQKTMQGTDFAIFETVLLN
jgi:hypothetical protein